MNLQPNVLLTKWYVLDRCTTCGTTGGTGYLEIFAPDARTAVEKARAYPWPAGSEIGAALAPDVFRVESWHRIGVRPDDEVARLRRALEYYANADHWELYDGGHPDPWKVARETLEGRPVDVPPVLPDETL